jgi:hypothetical protein
MLVKGRADLNDMEHLFYPDQQNYETVDRKEKTFIKKPSSSRN